MSTMTTIHKQAFKHATRIGWDTDEALKYAVALLTECNMHTEAAALVDAAEKHLNEQEAAMAREFPNGETE